MLPSGRLPQLPTSVATLSLLTNLILFAYIFFVGGSERQPGRMGHDAGPTIKGMAPLEVNTLFRGWTEPYCPSTSEPEVTCGTSKNWKEGGKNIYSCHCEGGPLGPGYTPYGQAYPIGNKGFLKSVYESGWWRKGHFESFAGYKAKATIVINFASG